MATATRAYFPAPGRLPDARSRPDWVEGWPALRQISDDIARPLTGRPSAAWFACTAVSLTALGIGVGCVSYQIATGIGVWGLNKTVGWAFDITNFVFWIGIGHAGTLISAILLLFRQRWRMSINRSAEAMTIFAVMCAALFPLIHMGRPWLAFWVLPYPNFRGPLWVNFRSPLLWDVFAINTYLTISLVFWYLGMIPDFATLRDRTSSRVKQWVYGLLSLGWNGSQRTWSRYETACLVLAGLATPLVLSVHSIVSMDFATSILPGWHTTIFPPYFVAGAVFSGFGMVLLLLIIARSVMNLQRYITLDHLDRMAKITLFTGSIVAFSYATEFFTAWYGSNPDERFAFVNRATGPYAWAFWTMVVCNVDGSAAPVAAPRAREPGPSPGHLRPDQRGDVVRALRHHRDVAPPELPAIELGDVRADGDRGRHAGGKLRAVFFLFSLFHPVPSHDRHVGDQGAGRRAALDSARGRAVGGSGGASA